MNVPCWTEELNNRHELKLASGALRLTVARGQLGYTATANNVRDTREYESLTRAKDAATDLAQRLIIQGKYELDRMKME